MQRVTPRDQYHIKLIDGEALRKEWSVIAVYQHLSLTGEHKIQHLTVRQSDTHTKDKLLLKQQQNLTVCQSDTHIKDKLLLKQQQNKEKPLQQLNRNLFRIFQYIIKTIISSQQKTACLIALKLTAISDVIVRNKCSLLVIIKVHA